MLLWEQTEGKIRSRLREGSVPICGTVTNMKWSDGFEKKRYNNEMEGT